MCSPIKALSQAESIDLDRTHPFLRGRKKTRAAAHDLVESAPCAAPAFRAILFACSVRQRSSSPFRLPADEKRAVESPYGEGVGEVNSRRSSAGGGAVDDECKEGRISFAQRGHVVRTAEGVSGVQHRSIC